MSPPSELKFTHWTSSQTVGKFVSFARYASEISIPMIRFFRRTDEPDPTMDIEFMNFLMSRCNSSHTSASSPSSTPLSPSPLALLSLSPSPSSFSPVNISAASSIQDTGMKMDYEGPGRGFGTLYYRDLLQGKGLLYVDQQLTAGEETETWQSAHLDYQSSRIALIQRPSLSCLGWGQIGRCS